MPVELSYDLIDSWLEQPSVTVTTPVPATAHFEKPAHRRWKRRQLPSDAHLAALALEYGAEVCSCDRDFVRFPALKWRDPLS